MKIKRDSINFQIYLNMKKGYRKALEEQKNIEQSQHGRVSINYDDSGPINIGLDQNFTTAKIQRKDRFSRSSTRLFNHFMIYGGNSQQRPKAVKKEKDLFESKKFQMFVKKKEVMIMSPKRARLKSALPKYGGVPKPQESLKVPKPEESLKVLQAQVRPEPSYRIDLSNQTIFQRPPLSTSIGTSNIQIEREEFLIMPVVTAVSKLISKEKEIQNPEQQIDEEEIQISQMLNRESDFRIYESIPDTKSISLQQVINENKTFEIEKVDEIIFENTQNLPTLQPINQEMEIEFQALNDRHMSTIKSKQMDLPYNQPLNKKVEKEIMMREEKHSTLNKIDVHQNQSQEYQESFKNLENNFSVQSLQRDIQRFNDSSDEEEVKVAQFNPSSDEEEVKVAHNPNEEDDISIPEDLGSSDEEARFNSENLAFQRNDSEVIMENAGIARQETNSQNIQQQMDYEQQYNLDYITSSVTDSDSMNDERKFLIKGLCEESIDSENIKKIDPKKLIAEIEKKKKEKMYVSTINILPQRGAVENVTFEEWSQSKSSIPANDIQSRSFVPDDGYISNTVLSPLQDESIPVAIRKSRILSQGTIQEFKSNPNFETALNINQQQNTFLDDIKDGESQVNLLPKPDEPKKEDSDSDSSSDLEIEEDTTLSYSRLMKFIAFHHPVDPVTGQNFLVWDRITVKNYLGKLFDPFGCYRLKEPLMKLKKYIEEKQRRGVEVPSHNRVRPQSLQELPESDSDHDSDDENEIKGITRASIHLGTGAVLYLQTLKTLAIMFFMLSVLNIPIFLFYSSSTQNNDYFNFQEGLRFFTIGNLAQQNPSCSPITINFKGEDENLKLRCPIPGQYMTQIQVYGFLQFLNPQTLQPPSGQQQCNQIQNTLGASFKGVQRRLQANPDILKDQISNIVNDISQNIPKDTPTPVEEEDLALQTQPPPNNSLNNTLYNLDHNCFSDNNDLYIDDSAKHEIEDFFTDHCFHKSECEFSPELMEPRDFHELFSDFCKVRTQIQKDGSRDMSDQFIFVVGCIGDSVALSETVQIGKEQILEIAVLFDMMSVFILLYCFNKISVLNEEFLNVYDDIHITMRDYAIQCDNVLVDKHTQDSRLVKMKVWLHFTKIVQQANMENKNLFENQVVDVTLSITTQPKLQMIFKMEQNQSRQAEIKTNMKLDKYKDEEYFERQTELTDLQRIYSNQKKSYQAILDEEKSENVKKKKVKGPKIQSIQYIFVTFKNPCSVIVAKKVFQKQSAAQKIINTLTCKKSKKAIQQEFQGQELTVSKALDPDSIFWQNLSFSQGSSGQRKTILKLASFFVSLVTLLSGILVDAQSKYVAATFPALKCPEDTITAEEAYFDVISEHPKDLMACFCQQHFKKAPWSTATITFEQYDIPDEEDTTPYCKEYTAGELQTKTSGALSSTSLIIINGIVAKVFQYLGEYQKKSTLIEQNQTCFDQIMLMEFFNTGLVILIVSFTPLSTYFVNAPDEDHVMKDRYNGFESDWYANVGKTLIITLTFNCFISNALDMRNFAQVMMARFKDRGYKPNLKKYPDEEEDDQPNTTKTAQPSLEVLYEGGVFENDKALSRMMSTLLVIMFFSSGMPVMYLFGFAFFAFTYVSNKILLIQFYKKTNITFSREIPMHCINLFKYAIFLKLINGLFMFLNPHILDLKENQSTYFENRFQQVESDNIYYSQCYQKMYVQFCGYFTGFFISGKILLELGTILAEKLTKHFKEKRAAQDIENQNQAAAIYEDPLLQEEIMFKQKSIDYTPNFFNELSMAGLKSFYQRAQKEYQDFKNYFMIKDIALVQEEGPLRQAFLEKCYFSDVDENDVYEYNQLHLTRMKQIDEVINKHFVRIKDVILKSKEQRRDKEIEKAEQAPEFEKNYKIQKVKEDYENDIELTFDEYCQMLKLKKLVEHQYDLIKIDKEEHDKQLICRISGGYAQSYFIFDSKRFKLAKEIFYNFKDKCKK